MTKAIFPDRDGTINHDKGFTHKIEDLEFMPGVIEGLKKLTATKKFKLFIITNQSGISLGHFTEQDFWNFTKHLTGQLKKEGITITATYFAPDHPEKSTHMRKPNIGMLQKAENEHKISLKESYVIGDRPSDVETGHNAGCKTVYIKNNAHRYDDSSSSKRKPDFTADNFLEAAEWIIKEEMK